MLAKRWVAAALAVGVVLVLMVVSDAWISREPSETAAARSQDAPRTAAHEEAGRDLPQPSARTAVDATEDAAEVVPEARAIPAKLGRLHGIVRGLRPMHAGSTKVVCETYHGREFVRASAPMGMDGSFEIAGLDTSTVYILRAAYGERERDLARSVAIEFRADERERFVELDIGDNLTTLVVRVRDEAGRPIDGASVNATGASIADGMPRHLARWMVLESTDAAGAAVFPSISPLPWTVEVRHRDHTSAAAQAVVRQGETTRVDVALRTGVELRGRLLTANGEPARNERLEFSFADDVSGALVSMRAEIDEQGCFLLRHAPAAELTPRVDRYRDPVVRTFLAFGSNVLAPVRAGAGEVDLVLPEPCKLVGRCVSANAAPELKVSASTEEDSSELTVTLGPQGEFSVPFEPRRGRLLLHLQPSDRSASPREGAGVVVDTQFPAPGGILDLGAIEFSREPVLSGVVRNAAGEAVPLALVRLEFDGPAELSAREATADIEGRFEFEAAPSMPGVLRIRDATNGQAELQLENAAKAARAGEVSLVLHPSARLKGRVAWNRVARRRPPQIVLVRGNSFGYRREHARVVASDTGEFELTAWPAEYELWLQWIGDETWVRGPRVTLELGRVTPLEWTVD